MLEDWCVLRVLKASRFCRLVTRLEGRSQWPSSGATPPRTRRATRPRRKHLPKGVGEPGRGLRRRSGACVKDRWLLRRAFPCLLSSPAASHLQETPSFSNSHSIRSEGEPSNHSNAVFFTSFGELLRTPSRRSSSQNPPSTSFGDGREISAH